VLGFDSDFICVIQAKAMAALTVTSQRSSTRAANVAKDIKKALGQLGGALSKIRSTSPVFDAEGKPIAIPNRETSLAHAIVVISEMYAFVDWKAVASEVVAASESEFHRALFHVVDIRELANLAGNCRNAETFSNRMTQRWFVVKERGTAYIRAKLSQ
jgi:hypothetical protein